MLPKRASSCVQPELKTGRNERFQWADLEIIRTDNVELRLLLLASDSADSSMSKVVFPGAGRDRAAWCSTDCTSSTNINDSRKHHIH